VTHEIIEGDCLDVMRGMPDCSVDAVICDPPYGTTACKWDSVIPFAPMWEQLKRVAKPRAAIVLFASQPFTSALVMSNPGMFRYEWIWQKNKATGHLNVSRMPLREHESVLIFGEESPTYFPQKTQAEPYLPRGGRRAGKDGVYGVKGKERQGSPDGSRFPRSILPFGYECGYHPTQKPVALMEYLVRTYTNEGETVLDFTCGSGTTGVACVNTGRNFIGIEREASYVAIARQRIAAASQQPALVHVA
jgi:DNA modification methylase